MNTFKYFRSKKPRDQKRVCLKNQCAARGIHMTAVKRGENRDAQRDANIMYEWMRFLNPKQARRQLVLNLNE